MARNLLPRGTLLTTTTRFYVTLIARPIFYTGLRHCCSGIDFITSGTHVEGLGKLDMGSGGFRNCGAWGQKSSAGPSFKNLLFTKIILQVFWLKFLRHKGVSNVFQ